MMTNVRGLGVWPAVMLHRVGKGGAGRSTGPGGAAPPQILLKSSSDSAIGVKPEARMPAAVGAVAMSPAAVSV